MPQDLGHFAMIACDMVKVAMRFLHRDASAGSLNSQCVDIVCYAGNDDALAGKRAAAPAAMKTDNSRSRLGRN
jgi:hypothetical protein